MRNHIAFIFVAVKVCCIFPIFSLFFVQFVKKLVKRIFIPDVYEMLKDFTPLKNGNRAAKVSNSWCVFKR